MIQSVAIRNWQSLRSVDLDLGRFTVIVGASSSGKSALMRALRAVASNTTGSASITRGADAAAIRVSLPHATVTLEYARGAWSYRLLVAGQESQFTKLNRSVPEQITAALGIDPVPTGGSSLNFAGQFDRPYLLTEPGSVVAREFGALTNVDRIYSAVREANRRRSVAAGTLKTRRADLEQLTVDAARFADLPARTALLDTAEQAAGRAARLAERISRLQAALGAVTVAESVLARTPAAVEVPEDTAARAAQQRLARFVELLTACTSAARAVEAAGAALTEAATSERELRARHQELLRSAGVCPTCAQPVP